MRVGKKPKVVDAKTTRSCVVRLENVSSPQVRSSPRPNKTVAATQGKKRLKPASTEKELVNTTPNNNKIMQKRSNNKATPSRDRTPQPAARSSLNATTTSTTTTTTTTSVRSNQKLKAMPKQQKPIAQPRKEETPPPTIAVGRSRRAIKPNPKYASDDLITPKIVKNVASLASVGATAKKSLATNAKQRKNSSSSEDFYNQRSDEYNNEFIDDTANNYNDKMYEIDDKDDQDSDFTDGEEYGVVKAKNPKGRPRKTTDFGHKNITLQRKNLAEALKTVGRKSSNETTPVTQTSVRSAPTQLQQLRRSLYAANAQRNANMLSGSGASTSGIGLKRKLEENERDASAPARKQMVVSTPSGSRVKSVPVKAAAIATAPANRLPSKVTAVSQSALSSEQTINGSKIRRPTATIFNTVSDKRKLLDKTKNITTSAIKLQNRPTGLKSYQANKNAAASTSITGNSISQHLQAHAKALASKTLELNTRLRSSSPNTDAQTKAISQPKNQTDVAMVAALQQQKQLQQKKSSAAASNSSTTTRKSFVKSNLSTPAAASETSQPSQHNAVAKSSKLPTGTKEKTADINDASPNSTIDDFETMPTFTIVNVNDIINKKGDVLITKSNKTASRKVNLELAESISLDDDDVDDDDDDEEAKELCSPPPTNVQKSKRSRVSSLQLSNEANNSNDGNMNTTKKSTSLGRKAAENKLSPASTSKNSPPEILNHKLGLRNSGRVKAKTSTLALPVSTTTVNKPAPRILNSVVAKKTQPVKPLIANPDDSADESFPLSLGEDETEDEENEFTNELRKIQNRKNKHNASAESMVDTDDTESQHTEQEDDTPNLTTTLASNASALTPKNSTISPTTLRKRRTNNNAPVISPKKKILTPSIVAKENSLALAKNQSRESNAKSASQLTSKKLNEKVVVSRQGDKIIKKITCFETWYVINMPPALEQKPRLALAKNELDMPLIKLANIAKTVLLPSELWTCKVTLYEVSASSLSKTTLVTYTGDLSEHNIREEDRGKFQPSCVMFRRSVRNRKDARMPYDRAVLFKNKTFYTNIEGKNVRLSGSPTTVTTLKDIEILLEIVDSLTLQSDFVEQASIVQQ